MERLWTPWRADFVQGAAADGATERACFLCELPKVDGEADRSNLVLHRAANVFVLLNLYPYNSGHLMIAPYTHCGDLAALDAAIGAELMQQVQRSVGILQREYRPEAFNVGMNLGKSAGAGVPDHLHVHVVPRWNGDTNYMPVLGGTKVLPESLEQTYDRLAPHFNRG